jgi:NADPH-dependent 2,4-dienoyl-CoA reductase/sulfur reductase-like enzyme/rhodanese-related sulfurtransferase
MKRVIIIGAVALGPKAACRFKRLEPDSEVTLIDSQKNIAYAECGIPYYFSGDISSEKELMLTNYGMIRDEYFFENSKSGIKLLRGVKALDINRKEKSVLVQKQTGEKESLFYDKLVIATGSKPRKLNVSENNLKNIFSIKSIEDAVKIKELITKGISKAVIIGGGFTGIQIAEAFSDMWGIETSVIEHTSQIMPDFISSSLAQIVMHDMKKNGVNFYLDEKVEAFEGEEFVEKVITNKRELEADIVISAIGIRPCTRLAKKAGIEIDDFGAIKVNEYMQTSDPDIYSGGDAVRIKNFITDKPGYFPLSSMAHRQGRVIGTNLAEKKNRFEGAVGSFVVKLFDYSLAGAGLSIQNALKEGFDAISVQMIQLDRAHFYPEKELMYLELVVDKKSRRALGIQGLGAANDATVARINAVAAILSQKLYIDAVSNLEIAYSPPFASAMDAINTLGNVAENVIEGRCNIINQKEFFDLWQDREKENIFIIDVRPAAGGKPSEKKYPNCWKSIPHDELKKRIDEVPKDKKLIILCNTGMRSYEAQLDLKHYGIEAVSLGAGMATLKKWGLFDE